MAAHYEPTTAAPRLAEVREAAGFHSQRALARAAGGVSHTLVWKAEHGYRVSLPKLIRICLALGCSLDDVR